MTQPDLRTRAQQNRPAPSGNPAPNSSEPIIEVEVGDDPEGVSVAVAWARVMRFCRGLPKGSTAEVKDKAGKVMYRYKYRSADDVMSLVGFALRAFGVTVMPVDVKHQTNISGQATTCTVDVRYAITSLGEGSMLGVSAGSAIDFGDKALVKALTQAYRAFLTTALTLPTYNVAWDSDANPVQRPMPPTPEELRDEMLNPGIKTSRMKAIYAELKRDPALGAQVVTIPNDGGPGDSTRETLLDLNVRLGRERAEAAASAASATPELPPEVEI